MEGYDLRERKVYLRELLEMKLTQKLTVSPGHLFIDEKSLIIECLLLNIPAPSIIVKLNLDGTLSSDSLYLFAITEYMSNNFKLQSKNKDLNGKKLSDLDIKIRSKLVNCYLVLNYTAASVSTEEQEALLDYQTKLFKILS